MSLPVSMQNVYFSYQDTPVLADVSFRIQEGEFLGIFGPNGGGKTTLLKLIMGFLKPDSGAIKIFGQHPNSCLEHISYVPQNIRFDKEFPISVLEVVLAGRLSRLPWYGRYSMEDKKAAMEALSLVGMEAFSGHAFGNLSGGQAQRTLIARALVSEPRLLLLDEPTASVDAQAEADIYSILKSLKGKMTILMVTHDLKAAINIVERVLCVQRNVISLMPQEVCKHFAIGLYHEPLIDISKKGDHT